MAEFTPITTQEEFDAAIGERLKRERRAITEQYGDYENLKTKVADYEAQIGGLTKERDALQAKVKGYESSSVKMRIAHETGIPYELADRLSGQTEDEIRADAKRISGFLAPVRQAAPLKSTEPANVSAQAAAWRTLTDKLTEEGE